MQSSAPVGFALVEMLVVTSILMALVAILVPVTIQARNRARTVECLSNLRQIGFALSAYGQDWNDSLPSLQGTPFAGSLPSDQWQGASSATHLREALSQYAKSTGVFRCANDAGSPEYGFEATTGSVFRNAGSSYLPWGTTRAGRYGVNVNGAKMASLSPASGHALIRDYGSDWHGFRTRSGLAIEETTVANALYADGHTAPVPLYTSALSMHRYVGWTLPKSKRVSYVFISGGSQDVRVELSGTRTLATGDGGQLETRVSLSGEVSEIDSVYNVDRVFTFGSDTPSDACFRKVMVWVDGLVSG